MADASFMHQSTLPSSVHMEDATRNATPQVLETPQPQDDHDTSTGDGFQQHQSPVEGGEEAARLAELATTVRDQDELERTIGRQADQMLLEQADERDQKRLEKTLSQKEKLVQQVRQLERRLQHAVGAATALRLRAEIQHMRRQIDALEVDLVQIQKRIDERHNGGEEDVQDTDQAGNRRQPGESRREFLIRTGKITPFSKVGQSLQRTSSSLGEALLEAEELAENDEDGREEEDEDPVQDEHVEAKSHRNLLQPGFAAVDASDEGDSTVESIDARARKRRKLLSRANLHDGGKRASSTSTEDLTADEFVPDAKEELSDAETSDIESLDFGVVVEGTDEQLARQRKRKPKRKQRATEEIEDAVASLAALDDGNEQLYQARLRKWVTGRKAARRKADNNMSTKHPPGASENETSAVDAAVSEMVDASGQEEWLLPHPTRADTEFAGGLRIPGDIWPSLFDYQKTGVQWLWELCTQQVGGIIGDEMGLGKTIQVISFLAGLHHSKKLTKPVIVVAPATVMKQWVNEFHRWWPPLRVSILHSSGSGMMDLGHEQVLEDKLESRAFIGSASKPRSASKAANRIVDRVVREGHILVTTYSGLQSYAEILIPVEWGYAVLDEGHKIRNPNTAITIYCKELRTANRIILSGTPMQNNLTELWSLFDFIFPMRLGTLVNFRQQFEIPIKQGGYANASNLQVETALKCAETLKDAISPYLLQRFKVDVAADLPKKTEQVLFCRLTKIQREAYEKFLDSNEMKSILDGKRQALYGIDILRKICNHPDLQDHRTLSVKPGYNYGSGNKSGKMQVVKALLELWKDTGHKTLLFAQHRIMLDILEKFIQVMGGFKYCRMDGNTPIRERQDMVDHFNATPDLHVFLLTTKVGGLGVNLTGADRVIIYDPDWNPSTDVQARERAWRLGQKRDVMIYRLMTAGTIEEKIYHRQIFKQFLTNKILRDPKQRQTFQLKDLHDLFTLGNANDSGTETSDIFKGVEVKFDQDKTATTHDPGLPTPPTEEDDTSKVSSIIGISHRETFAGDMKEGPTATAMTGTSGSDQGHSSSNLLSTIFARSGVHSALEHDAIVSGAGKPGVVKPDAGIIAREAKRVAAEAARELQRAAEVAKTVPIGTPTWTGEVGIAGRPDEPPRTNGRGGFGGRGGRGGLPSSSAVLANLSARQGRPVGAAKRLEDPHQPKGKDFLVLIRDYMLAHGGAVYTQMLIDHFNRFCGTPTRTAEFKEMLRAIAVLDNGNAGVSGSRAGSANGRRGRGGRGRWVLKKEFGGEA